MKQRFYKILILLFVAIIVPVFHLHSQAFFPLKTGNKFVYRFSRSSYPPYNSNIYYKISSIKNDTLINGRKYFFTSYFPFESPSDSLYVRVDSLTGSLYRYDSSNSCSYFNFEKLIDSLGMTGGLQGNCAFLDDNFNQGTGTLFGYQTNFKLFGFHMSTPWGSSNSSRKYNSKFGLVEIYSGSSGSGSFYNDDGLLTGCIINDTLFGDTATTSIISGATVLPDKFSLINNFPNPFNQSTLILFQIPLSRSISISVYDVSGREVEVLVSRKFEPGIHSVLFDAGYLSSGVYFYTMGVDGIRIDTKRMVLLK